MQGIYRRIREACEERHITLRDLEEIMYMKPMALEELRTEMPSIFELILLSKALEKSPYWIKSGQKLNKLNIDEECLIMLFRQLDTRGKKTVENTASFQIRMKNIKK